jgi:hypothetical protein
LRLYGAVIRTRNLDALRRFLSEVVGLGPPVVDSNFWLEYELSEGSMVLAIEHDQTAIPPRDEDECTNVCWCMCVDNLEDFEKRMSERGFGPEGARDTPTGGRALVFRDPEGNRFMAIGDS